MAASYLLPVFEIDPFLWIGKESGTATLAERRANAASCLDPRDTEEFRTEGGVLVELMDRCVEETFEEERGQDAREPESPTDRATLS